MRYIALCDVEPGMRLAYDLYDSFGRTLVGGNCELTTYYIDKLHEYGFDGIYIDDEISKGINVESVVLPQLRNEGLQCVREGDIDGCRRVAHQMVKDILERGVLSLDMTDLRIYDDYTYAHSVNVATICCVIGIGMEMKEENLTDLVTAALLHDLGKLQIPEEILNKPGRLTPEEYQVMKSHVTLSYELISERWDLSAQIKEAVFCHHENVDGSGYPNGTDGSGQTLFTKILHVADVYDALVSARPYKKPYCSYEACEYLMGGCGIMFEQKVVEVLLKFVPLYPKGTEVILSDGRRGIIYENSGIHNLRPMIRLMDGSMIDLMDKDTLHLTLTVPLEEQGESIEHAEREREVMLKPCRRYHILVVDDIKTSLQKLRSILEPVYDVTLVKSGKQALTYMETNPRPDMVLMDIDMPQMNGIEVAGRIQEMTDKEVPILFVTAICDKETVTICRNMDIAGYILRPYKPVYVKSEIKRILTGRSEIE